MARIGLTSAALAFVCAACFVPDVNLEGRACPCVDGYACVANVCVKSGGTTGAGGAAGGTTTTTSATTASASTSATASGSASTGPTTSSSSSSTGSGSMPLTPLVIDSGVATGTLSLSVDHFFRIQSTPASDWQWTVWRDLANGGVDNLASTEPAVEGVYSNLLLEPLYVNDGTTWHDVSGAAVSGVTVTDETPARVTVDATLAFLPGLQVHTVYSVYASGRVASLVTMTNTSAAALNFPMTESNYTSVNGHLANGTLSWSKTSYMAEAGGFLRQDGPSPKSSLLSINTLKQTDLIADAMNTNWYWGEAPAVMLAPAQSFSFSGELQLGPGDQTQITHATHADDVLNPELTVVSGGAPVGSGYDVARSAYTIAANAGATSVVFGPTTSRARFRPAFVITGFTAPKWHVTLGGQELVSSAALDGVGALASSANNEIVIVLGSTIAQGAPDSARLLTLSAQ